MERWPIDGDARIGTVSEAGARCTASKKFDEFGNKNNRGIDDTVRGFFGTGVSLFHELAGAPGFTETDSAGGHEFFEHSHRAAGLPGSRPRRRRPVGFRMLHLP